VGPIPARAVAQSGSKKDVIRKPEFVEVAPPHISKELKKRWSYFIRKVYETDPLVCPKCSGEMHIISYIDQGAVTRLFTPRRASNRTSSSVKVQPGI